MELGGERIMLSSALCIADKHNQDSENGNQSLNWLKTFALRLSEMGFSETVSLKLLAARDAAALDI